MDAKRVAGVSGVANEIQVRLPDVDRRPDPEIARDAVAALKTELPFSWEKIKVIVRSGWITLEGGRGLELPARASREGGPSRQGRTGSDQLPRGEAGGAAG
jgi:hypothetical protein